MAQQHRYPCVRVRRLGRPYLRSTALSCAAPRSALLGLGASAPRRLLAAGARFSHTARGALCVARPEGSASAVCLAWLRSAGAGCCDARVDRAVYVAAGSVFAEERGTKGERSASEDPFRSQHHARYADPTASGPGGHRQHGRPTWPASSMQGRRRCSRVLGCSCCLRCPCLLRPGPPAHRPPSPSWAVVAIQVVRVAPPR